MIKSLKKLGHTVKECHVSLWGNKIDKTKSFSGIFGKLLLMLKLLSIYPRLFLKYLFVGQYDVMFVGYFGHLDMFFAKLFSILTFRRKKIIFDAFISLYDTMVSDRKMLKEHSFFSKIVFWLDKLSCRLADTVILDTNAHIDFFHKTFNVTKEKMVRIFASADTDVFYPRQVKKDNNVFNVLFMGKYTPLHGIKYIVEAVETLRENKDIKFTFIGKGQLYPEIRQMVKGKKLDNIEFIEWVEYEKLPDYIARADVCLGIFGNSDKAARVIPNKVFQTMGMGICVLTMESQGIKELLVNGENAVLCNMANPKSITESIKLLKSNSDFLNTLRSNGYNTFTEFCGYNGICRCIGMILNNRV
ncbi:MAG: glycosyltransferase family 4 protein [Desulfobacteraceae bacterium]|nr:glycosyltransferase family 4 protein [Desulfobacteraceae bacterium]MBC2720377.1 glycosyltransferase [Desulfobacteraceae bacterium]